MNLKTLRKKANWHLKNDILTSAEERYLVSFLDMDYINEYDIVVISRILSKMAIRTKSSSHEPINFYQCLSEDSTKGIIV
jgi:hypothetical protein